jgi:hypothetical protein
MAVWSIGGRAPSSGRSPLSSEANAMPPLRAVQNSGLMPNWSRASVSVHCRSSTSAKANMPRRRRRLAGPQRRHASSSTSVSELVRKLTPAAQSSARSWR